MMNEAHEIFLKQLKQWQSTKDLTVFSNEASRAIKKAIPSKHVSDAVKHEEIFRRVVQILALFEESSRLSASGDAYLTYKTFNLMLFNTLSLYAIKMGKPAEEWEDPPNIIKQMESDIDRRFISGIFPNVDAESININKLNFIDWFGSLLEELEDVFGKDALPMVATDCEKFLRAIYKRDYLFNVRKVRHLQKIFRGPNPNRLLTEPELLEDYFYRNRISLIIDLRGPKEASCEAYSVPFLNRILPAPPGREPLPPVRMMCVDFNEPASSAGAGPGYVRKLVSLKNVIKTVFEAIAANPGSTFLHCAAGKDRTGVMVALLQKIAGVSDEDVVEEYTATGLDARPKRMHEVLEYINKNGGIEAYLAGCGLDTDFLQKLRQHILTPI